MPFIRSSVSERRARVIAVILLFSEIMPTCSRCVLNGLVCVIIIAPLGRQPSFYIKYTKSNIHSSCDIRLVSIAKCICFIHSCIL